MTHMAGEGAALCKTFLMTAHIFTFVQTLDYFLFFPWSIVNLWVKKKIKFHNKPFPFCQSPDKLRTRRWRCRSSIWTCTWWSWSEKYPPDFKIVNHCVETGWLTHRPHWPVSTNCSSKTHLREELPEPEGSPHLKRRHTPAPVVATYQAFQQGEVARLSLVRN